MDKYTLQTLGFALIVLGVFLFMLGLLAGPIELLTGEPLPWYWWVPTASIFSGIALVVSGVILLIVARSVNPDQAGGKWVDARIPGRKESRFWIPERHIMTFEEAKGFPDAYLVMEGDYGGQCYMTAPIRMAVCQESEIRQLLPDIDEIFWQDVEGQRLYFERHKPGDGIDSGMGGGLILDDVWIHKQLVELGLETNIRKVLSGELYRLELSEAELGRLRERVSSIEERSKYLDY